MLNGTVKYRVAKFRLRKERLTELGALAAVHGRAAAQLAAAGDAAPTAIVRAALEVGLLSRAVHVCPQMLCPSAMCPASACQTCIIPLCLSSCDLSKPAE
jgi:hypothetical protein